MRRPRTSTGGAGAAAALLAILALSACSAIGLDSDDPSSDDDPAAEVTASADDAETLPAPGDPDAADAESDAEAAGAETDSDAADAQAADAGTEVARTGDAAEGTAAEATDAGPVDAAAAAEAPHVYMSLQPDTGGQISVVFAIDRSRDGTPSDEPAIRITPEATEAQAGRCNPQQLRYYKFPPDSADRPVYGPDEALRGVGARDLPGFMATAVSSEMIVTGVAEDLEDTRPQNICTRKLFEQTIIAATTGQG